MGLGGPCRVRSKLNKFERVWGPWPEVGKGLGGGGGPFMVRYHALWAMVTWDPPYRQYDRQM